jgi:STE24 endopeptidase
MDILHTQLNNIQRHLAFVAVDDIDWKFYVQLFSWSVTLFESYLLYALYFLVSFLPVSNNPQRIRQYPLYSKTEPPASLAKHFEPGVFEKSQNYGKDKAKFALVSGILKQLLDSRMLQYGFYAWSWGASQSIMTKIGYGQGYEVKNHSFIKLRQQLISEPPADR